MTDPLAPATPLVAIPIWSVVLFVVMAVVTTALAIYLITTNPPKDESAFVGIGKEKFTDEELGALGDEESNEGS